MTPKLILLDIDGTLIAPGTAAPPDSAMEAIRAAQRRGHQVFICTGRNRHLSSFVKEFGFDHIVSCTGRYIEVAGETIFDHPLPEEERVRQLNALRENGIYCNMQALDCTFADEEWLACMTGTFGDREEVSRILGRQLMADYDGRPIYKFSFFCATEEQYTRAGEQLGPGVQVCMDCIAGKYALLNGELIERAYDKGAALAWLCRYLHIPREDSVAFGDSTNDLSMLLAAGTGVCMGNGGEALKARADMVCPPLLEDGLARAFVELGLV